MVRVQKENIEIIEDTGSKTATIHKMDETYTLETYEQGSKHGYTNTSRMNENTTEYIGRLGRHESTHALVNSGVWKDMYPSTPERFPEERE